MKIIFLYSVQKQEEAPLDLVDIGLLDFIRLQFPHDALHSGHAGGVHLFRLFQFC